MQNKGMMWAVIVLGVLIIAAVAYAVMNPMTHMESETATTTPESTTNGAAPATGVNAPSGSTGTASGGTAAGTSAPVTTIMYTDNGFAPNSITIKKGTKVTFVNQSQLKMWIGSDNHPDHTGYSGTDKSVHCPDTTGTAFDQCASVNTGGSYSFTFNKTGTWGYHNHAAREDEGTIIVVP